MTHQQIIGATKRHTSCTVIRRVLTSHFQTFPVDGRRRLVRREWSTKLCGTPLFSGDDVYEGVCQACKEGWKHPHNYPAEETQPERCTDPTHPECDQMIRDPESK